MTKARKILITGGVRSGKSRFALFLTREFAQQKIFIATAQPFDPEIKKRIERHQEERGKSFSTLEEPLYLSKAMDSLPPNGVAVIDCLTLWLNNLLFHFKDNENRVTEQIDLLINSLETSLSTVIVITNETGWGIIPTNKLSRQFIEKMGLINQRIAANSDEVILLVAGLPYWMKGKKNDQSLSR